LELYINGGIHNQSIIIHAAGDDRSSAQHYLEPEVEFMSIAMLTNDILQA